MKNKPIVADDVSSSFQFRTSYQPDRPDRIIDFRALDWRSSVKMSELRIGPKQAVLHRIQSGSTKTSAEIRQHTDFSINRILSSSRTSKDPNPIDLSKSNQIDIVDAIQPRPSDPTVSNLVYYQQQLRTTMASDRLVRPKVYKFWDPNAFSNNCNGCDRYFKNVRFSNVTDLDGGLLWNSFHSPTHSSDFIERFSMRSTTIGSKSDHGQLRDDEISHKCAICDKVFGCASTLEAHERTHRAPRYECLDCGKGFSQLRNYKYHLSVHRGTKEFAAECSECGKTFNDKGYLSSHMKIHRNKKEYECPYCPKSFNQRVAFNMHVRIHTGVKPHKCTECGKRFSRKMLLKQHMRTHSGEKPYQCTVCGKSFADRSNMTLHHRLHSGIKPFTCPICPKAFTKKHHLKTHLNYHTGCKPYVCPHPNCNQAFTQSSNMRTHAKKCQFRPITEVPTN